MTGLMNYIARSTYSKFLLWLRAVRLRDFVWLLKVAMFYLLSILIPWFWKLRDRIFPPSREIAILRIKHNKFIVIWRDPAVLNAFTEIFFKGVYDFTDIQGDEVVLDLGANVGAYTLYVADRLNKGLVVAVEPEPYNALLLKYNVKLNKLSNVIVVEKAISDRAGCAKLYISPYAASHSIVEAFSKGGYILVPTTTIDLLLKELKLSKIDIVKMDIEGAEYLALKGGLKTLSSSKSLRLIISAEHDPSTTAKCLCLLKELGFRAVYDKVSHIVYAHR